MADAKTSKIKFSIPKGNLIFNNRLAVFFLIFIGLCAYANALNNSFVWDDKYLILGNPYITNFKYIKDIFTHPLFEIPAESAYAHYRPLQTLSYIVDYYIWGYLAFGYHLTNILLHILNALLVYFLLELIFRQRILAFVTSLIFVLHPLNIAAVTYISGRADLLAIFFMLSSLILFFQYLNKLKVAYYFYSIILFCLALLSKEFALILILFLPLINSASPKKISNKFKYSPFIFIFLIYIILYFVLMLNFKPAELGIENNSILKTITFFRAVFYYFSLLILPINLHMERVIKISQSILEPLGILSILLSLIFIIMATIKFRRKFNALSFGFCWFIFGILPIFFAMFGYQEFFSLNLAIIAEHWLYFSLSGAGLVIGYMMVLLLKSKKYLVKLATAVIFFIIIVFYFLQTINMNKTWQDNFVFAKYNLRFAPYSARLWRLLGTHYAENNKIEEAIAVYKKALYANPYSYTTHIFLGLAYEAKKDFSLAEESYNKALRIKPFSPIVYYNRGMIYFKEREIEKARADWRKAFELNSNYPLPYNKLASSYKDDSQIKKYKELINKQTQNIDFYHTLAKLYLDRGLYLDAIQILKKAIGMMPKDYIAYNALGYIYIKINNPKQALQNLHKSIEIFPNKEAYNNLGSLYAMMGNLKKATFFWQEALKIDPDYQDAKNNLLKSKKID